MTDQKRTDITTLAVRDEDAERAIDVSTLTGMTQEKWDRMSAAEKAAVRDNSDLSPQLIGLEGWQVEVLDKAGDTPHRFYVGKSTGWRPCHLEIVRINSLGGHPASKTYFAVRRLDKRRY